MLFIVMFIINKYLEIILSFSISEWINKLWIIFRVEFNIVMKIGWKDRGLDVGILSGGIVV